MWERAQGSLHFCLEQVDWLICFPCYSLKLSPWLCLQPLISFPRAFVKYIFLCCPTPGDHPLPALSWLRPGASYLPHALNEEKWTRGLVCLKIEAGYKGIHIILTERAALLISFSAIRPSLFWPGPANGPAAEVPP